MTAEHDRARDAVLIASLLAIDPRGLGGVWLRVRSPDLQRDFVRLLANLPRPLQKISPDIDDASLFGGTDLAASLSGGRVIRSQGALERHSCLWLAQAQNTQDGLSARLSASLDAGLSEALVLADEGCDDDEFAPARLRERVAFFWHDESLPVSGLQTASTDEGDIVAARHRLATVEVRDEDIVRVALVCAELGIGDARVPQFVLKAARALAALLNQPRIGSVDLETTFRLVLAHRAHTAKIDPEEQPEIEKRQKEEAPVERDSQKGLCDAEVVVEAALTHVPRDLLAQITQIGRNGKGKGMGATRVSRLRGRPLPSRQGAPGGRARPDILATLHAAAPWQQLRGRNGALKVRTEDIRTKRFQDRSERVLIFAIDVSGSAAMARLAEAKGAATALLSKAYESRDRVALIGFRRDAAEIVLPPTRSLTRTKRQLAGMAGGGATPLAHGLRAAGELALQARKQGLTPQIILMTDGRANCDLSGSMDRDQAERDALKMARWIASVEVPVRVLDSGLRPSRSLQDIAMALGTEAIALKRAPAGRRGSVLWLSSPA